MFICYMLGIYFFAPLFSIRLLSGVGGSGCPDTPPECEVGWEGTVDFILFHFILYFFDL